MKKILVLTDFSNCANVALTVALSIAKERTAEVEIVHVVESPEFRYPTLDFSAIPVAYFSEIRKELFDQADKQLKKIEEISHRYGVRIGTHVEEGMILQTLFELTNKGDYDMVVLGTKGASGLDEILVGSNAQKIVRNSNVPVLTVGNTRTDFKVNKIVIASDFEEVEKMDVTYLKEFTTGLNAEVHLLGVAMPLDREQKDKMKSRMSAFAKQAGIAKYEGNVLYSSDVTEAITTYAKEVNADLLVMHTHGYQGLKQWFHNSVAEAVVNHSSVPVLTLKFS